MQTIRLRLTVRRMMAAVAILAILIAMGLQWWRLHQKAEYHAWGIVLSGNLKGPMGEELAEYHARLRDKYESASARPWLPVDPDPPPP